MAIQCPCRGERFEPLHTYVEAPKGETAFGIPMGSYRRQLHRCAACGHVLSTHAMTLRDFYEGQYVSATYGDDGLRRAFDRITALDPSRSDNVGRVKRILDYSAVHFGSAAPRSVIDVGSGLCVFLHRMKAAGWSGTALDPDARAVAHARQTVGVAAVQGDFMTAKGLGLFDVVSFNKVLEHVEDPVAMLARTREVVRPEGFVYVELPDGEAAWAEGPGREEFFIEHFHVFSAASIALLGSRAGFAVRLIERLREPSTKYTLRMFLTLR